MRTCINGHPDRGPLDRTKRGECVHCERDSAAKYRAKRKAALDFVRKLEAAGVDVSDLDKAERVIVAAKLVGLTSELSEGQAQLALQRDAKLRTAAFELLDGLEHVARKHRIG